MLHSFFNGNNLDGTSEIKRAGRLVYNDILHLKTDGPVDFHTWNTYSFNLEHHIDVEPGAMYRVIFRTRKKNTAYFLVQMIQRQLNKL